MPTPSDRDDPVRPDEREARDMTVLPREVQSVGRARGWLRSFLASHASPDRQIEDAALVISELVTNALRHGLGEVVVRTSIDEQASVYVAVTDSGDEVPVMQPVDPNRIGGLGLRVVDELSSGWGVAHFPGGKTVWATIPSPRA